MDPRGGLKVGCNLLKNRVQISNPSLVINDHSLSLNPFVNFNRWKTSKYTTHALHFHGNFAQYLAYMHQTKT